MATNREKQLTIQLLKERIEFQTGKKVILRESEKKIFDLYKVDSLSTKISKVLTDKTQNKLYVYKLEKDNNWVLYDAIEKNSKVVPTTSYRMSKVQVNILPLTSLGKVLKERIEFQTGKKVTLKEAAKPAQEKIRDFLIKNPGVTRKQIYQDLFGISPEAARKDYGRSGAHTVENTLSRALISHLITMDNSVKPAKWYAVTGNQTTSTPEVATPEASTPEASTPAAFSRGPNEDIFEIYEDTDAAGMGAEMAIDDMIQEFKERINDAIKQIGSRFQPGDDATLRIAIKRLWVDKIKQWKSNE